MMFFAAFCVFTTLLEIGGAQIGRRPADLVRYSPSKGLQIGRRSPRSLPGHRIHYSLSKGEFASAPYVACSPPKCDPPCELDYSTKPCPSCNCNNNPPPMIMCSPPKCDAPCRLNYNTRPCPSCQCDYGSPCKAPRCDAPCYVNYLTKPCPSCECPTVQCALPTPCNPPCEMIYSTSPCSSCKCPGKKPVQCPAPSCQPGYYLFYVPTELCPVCKDDADGQNQSLARCPPVDECEPPCWINRSNRPCPSCQCIHCLLPRCPPPCRVNFESLPCASCECEGTASVQCTMPKCRSGCGINLDTVPCPSCSCNRTSTI